MDGCVIELTPVIGLALEVIAGKWGNGDERENALEANGYDYEKVQSCVNDLLEVMRKYNG